MAVVIEIARFLLAVGLAILAVSTLRVTHDLLRYGRAEIERRNNPSNYDTKIVGMCVERDGAVKFRTARIYNRGI